RSQFLKSNLTRHFDGSTCHDLFMRCRKSLLNWIFWKCDHSRIFLELGIEIAIPKVQFDQTLRRIDLP
ncbi:MAG: hypothetical protein MKZ95_07140, partial [Pirellulales bacterium]|nr:hypothetical protein [Pirellulales bacterium]